MSWSVRKEARYWADEFEGFARRFRWVLVGLMILTLVDVLTTWLPLVWWLNGFVVLIFVLRRLRVWGNIDEALRRARQRSISRHIVVVWPALAQTLRLEAHGPSGSRIAAGIGSPSWDADACLIPLYLPSGLTRGDVGGHLDRIAAAFGAHRATLSGARIDHLELRLYYADPLAEPFVLAPSDEWDGRAVTMGRTEEGDDWRFRLGPHTLVAGASGSGKASIVWALLLGLAGAVRSGMVEVWGVDLKGGMELGMGKPLLTRFANDSVHAVIMLEEAVAQMQARARDLAGMTRQHEASTEAPLVIVLIDELAALTAYEPDRDLQRRANASIATLASQGRAVGFVVIACLQDPRKETLPARGLFTQTVGLRLRDRTETSMVLGDGSVAAGALCHEIPIGAPGTAYVLSDELATPQRVRAGYADDALITHTARAFAAPRFKPVVVPETQSAREPARPRRRPRSAAQSKEES